MSQAFVAARSYDWVSYTHALADLIQAHSCDRCAPDLVVCSGRYVNSDWQPTIASSFSHKSSASHGTALFWTDLSAFRYRRFLFLVATAPRQATFFGPAAI